MTGNVAASEAGSETATATATATDARSRRRDLLVLLGLLALAALLRLPNLATRGTWDGDQGHDMLVLRALVQDGIVPLLGPPTSIGDVHHGAWYYYLLSPAAFLTGGDSPLAVVTLIAVAGVAAVGVVWWLARAIGGSVAGFAAGLVIAVSAAAIDESTFIWNPNLIALSSAIALAGAWRAWSGGRAWWWVVATIGVAVTMQCHVLGVALLPIVGALFVLDARRRPLGRVAVASVVVLVIAYLPLLANELTTDFSEVHAALDYLAGGREAASTALPIRFLIVGIRVISWPLVGLVTEGFVAAIVVTAAVVAIVAWAWRPRSNGLGVGATADESIVARWFGLGLLWTTLFLTIAAPIARRRRPWSPQRPLPRLRRPDGIRARGPRRRHGAAWWRAPPGRCGRDGGPGPAGGLERDPPAAVAPSGRWLPGGPGGWGSGGRCAHGGGRAA